MAHRRFMVIRLWDTASPMWAVVDTGVTPEEVVYRSYSENNAYTHAWSHNERVGEDMTKDEY